MRYCCKVTRRNMLVMCAGSCVGACFRSTTVLTEPETSGKRDAILVDLSEIDVGETKDVRWNDQLVYVRHRTTAEIEAARNATEGELVDPEADEARVLKPEWIVVIGVCTHAGCKPIEGLGKFGGWLCLCHGSDFDTSGRIRSGPALENLAIPPYDFVSPETLRIGVR